MTDYNLVADVASYQRDDAQFFEALKNNGVKAVFVKLTEGTTYINPKAQNQINNAKSAGLKVHAYHYAHFNNQAQAESEANFFTNTAKQMGLNYNSFMSLDYEEPSLVVKNTANCNAFLTQVMNNGFHLVNCYSSASWFKNGIINVDQLGTSNYWVASYGTDCPGVDKTGLWQFTDHYAVDGSQIDMSYDFFGIYTDKLPKQEMPKVNATKVPEQFTDSLGDVWYKEDGTFTLDRNICLKWGAKPSSAILAQCLKGDSIKYDAFSLHDGYVWIRQPRPNGEYGYMATGEETNGKRTTYWGAFK